MGRRHAWSIALALGSIVLAVAVALPQAAPGDPPAAKPNVVLITTDDQTLEEMWALPQTAAWLGEGGGGTTFERAYVSYPLCCPSRATILSGQYMHNNGVRGNSGNLGGWQAFRGGGAEAGALPTWLQDAGYYTVQIGKYMNGWTGTAPIPPGWDEWYGKVSDYDPAVYGHRIYFNYQLREDPPVDGGVRCPTAKPAAPGKAFTCTYGQSASDYQTDVLRDKAVEAIHRLGGDKNPQRPFFINLAFNAPHSPYIPAPRHTGQYAGVEIRDPAGSNERRVSDKPRFLRRLPRLGRGKLAGIGDRRRTRAEMLISVDEAILAVISALATTNELGNTYLIFTSDNGYFSGEHRIRQGKYLPHEPSSHVPLLLRGPGVPVGVSDELVSNVDIAETIRVIGGASAKLLQDGRSLLPYTFPGTDSTRPLLLEGDTGPGVGIDDEGIEGPDLADERRLRKYDKRLRKEKRELRRRCKRLKRKSPKRALLCFRRGVRNLEQEPTDSSYNLRAPAFRSLRTDRYLLTLYSTGEVELYDMRRDPHQLRSMHRSKKYRDVRKWMLAELKQYSTCAGASCLEEAGKEPRRLKRKDIEREARKSRRR